MSQQDKEIEKQMMDTTKELQQDVPYIAEAAKNFISVIIAKQTFTFSEAASKKIKEASTSASSASLVLVESKSNSKASTAGKADTAASSSVSLPSSSIESFIFDDLLEMTTIIKNLVSAINQVDLVPYKDYGKHFPQVGIFSAFSSHLHINMNIEE